MIGTISVWTWDARPYPAWPARTDAWGDGPQWPLGHWLTGKIGLADLGALVAERCARVGFTAIDVSGLFGVVTGYVRDQPMSPRAEIEMLMNAFAFDAVESEGVIRFVPRGRAPVASIAVAGCVLPEQGEIATLIRAEESDLPDIVSITFIDGNGDYQSGSISASRLAGWSERKSDLSLALVMDELQAQTMADRALAEAWIGRETARLGLPPSLVAVDPGDVVDLIVDGRPRSFRLTRISDSGPRAVEAQRTEAAIYTTPLPGIAPPAFVPPTIYGRALLEIMDLPLLQDTDVACAPYVAASSSPFAGVTVLDSPTGDDFAVDTVLPLKATIGETVFDFYSGPTDYFDVVNTLRVKLYSGELSSAPEATILSGRSNALALQNPAGDWEIVQFCNADARRHQHLRPDQAAPRPPRHRACHGRAVAGRRDGGGPERRRRPAAGDARRARADALLQVGPELSVDIADPAWQQETFVARAVGLMPWAPVHVAGDRNASGDLSISWVRRTRLGGVWADGTDVPLNEESERYEVDILGGSTVLRTIAVTSPAATYTAAQQTADFGAPQPAITLKVYQLSAAVGRGWPASATL